MNEEKTENTEIAMNIYEKLQKCRVEVQNSGVKKSGKNKYSNYEYFELSDFLPSINTSMDTHKLTSIFSFSKEEATLQIINSEKPEEKILFKTPVAIVPLKGCNDMQSIGASQSYARRYLYFMAFEIAENDVMDKAGEIDKEKAFAIGKIDPIKVDTIKAMLKKTNSNKQTFLQFFKVKRVEDITNGQFRKVMDTLEQKQEQLQKHKEESQRFKQNTIPDLGI